MLVWKGLSWCHICILLTFNWLKALCLVLLVPGAPVKSTLQLWWSIQERRGYQWLLINLTLCPLTKKQRNKVEFQCRRLSQSQRAQCRIMHLIGIFTLVRTTWDYIKDRWSYINKTMRPCYAITSSHLGLLQDRKGLRACIHGRTVHLLLLLQDWFWLWELYGSFVLSERR